jgi:hypothetical protein
MRVLTNLLLGIFLLTALYSQGQPPDGGQGEIEKVEIEIIRDKQITLKKAERNFEKIPPRPVEPIKPAITYDLVNIPFSISEFNPSIRPLRAQSEVLPRLNGNYIAAGVGNFGSLYLESYLTTKRDRNKWYGAKIYHRGFSKGPVDDKNSASSHSSLGLFGTSFGKSVTTTGELNYQDVGTSFYGYDPTEPVNRDTLRQRYGIFDLSVRFENTKQADFNYTLSGSFSYLQDRLEAAESDVTLRFQSDYKVKDHRLRLQADYSLIARKDQAIDAKPRHLFRLKPAYEFTILENLVMQAGFNLAIEDDTLGKDKSVHIYPHARAAYTLTGGNAVLYAQLSGDMDKVNLHGLAAENRWVGSNVGIYHTNRSIDFSGGIQGKLAKKLTYEAGFSWANLKNFYFFQNRAVQPEKFDVLYDQGNVKRSNLFASLAYDQSEKLKLGFRADYYSYFVDELPEVWHRPTYRMRVNVLYTLVEKIIIRTDLMTQGGMKAFDTGLGKTVTLDNALDLGVRLDYVLSPRFSVFAKGENLMGQEYPSFLGYPVRGVQLLGGLTWTF